LVVVIFGLLEIPVFCTSQVIGWKDCLQNDI